ncbi:MAG: hypothetical protein ACD_3C00054G0012 [uncultured bacterium (gcode 4)]|uniref:Uncharacterized protein n=1 Tax=uncultured bacterium (gcode 4) TaxID=1234023 RepID=K2G2I9_9BACT|nr:MAG: hypothetical protein ACD_3C00054G0012 [uncultured bacterium (gcode 4)]
MFKKDSEYTEKEKIDYIFSKMRNQARMWAVLTAFKFIVYGWIIYFYFIIVPSLDLDKLADEYLIPKMSKIVQMTAEKTMQNVDPNMFNDVANNSQIQQMVNQQMDNVDNQITQSWNVIQNKKKNVPKVNITPEMIDAVQKAMEKQ